MPLINTRHNIDDAIRFSISPLNEILREKEQITKCLFKLDHKNEIEIKINTYSNFINLCYTFQKQTINQFIELEAKTTNLDNGLIWYFLCPETEQRCRHLYLAFESLHFKSKDAYAKVNQRMYYQTQILKPSEYAIYRTDQLESMYKNFSFKNLKKTYRGKQTSTLTKYNKMMNKLEKFTELSNKQFCKEYNL